MGECRWFDRQCSERVQLFRTEAHIRGGCIGAQFAHALGSHDHRGHGRARQQPRERELLHPQTPLAGQPIDFERDSDLGPAGADLLDAAQWTVSEFLPSDQSWNGGDFNAWLEGNAVVAPDGALLNVLRVQTRSPDEKAALVRVAADGKSLAFDPAEGFAAFPGGAKKFAIRADPQTKLYFALATIVHESCRAPNPGAIRNTLALTSSPDLKTWTVRRVLLHHPDVAKHGFQYPDWHFDGEDIIAVVRTAYDDGLGGARNNHDANFMTFHRFADFRRPLPSD